MRRFETNSEVLRIPIEDDHIPNIYVGVVLYRPPTEDDPYPRYHVGYVELSVSTAPRRLDVSIRPDRDEAQPGETVGYEVLVTDSEGQGVAADVSVAVVDQAVLSLVNEVGPDGMGAFWFERAPRGCGPPHRSRSRSTGAMRTSMTAPREKKVAATTTRRTRRRSTGRGSGRRSGRSGRGGGAPRARQQQRPAARSLRLPLHGAVDRAAPNGRAGQGRLRPPAARQRHDLARPRARRHGRDAGRRGREASCWSRSRCSYGRPCRASCGWETR